MVETSQNGWTVLESRPPYKSVPRIEPNVQFALRPGSVSVILLEVARRWHNEVERLDLPGEKDEWGWADRPVRGQKTGFSNHASGTAIDLNATRHPRGVAASDSLNSVQISRCRAIVQSMKDKDTGKVVVRWGGDYTGTPDAMHWEIADGVDQQMAARVAARILDKYAEADRAALEATEGERYDMFLASVPGEDKRVFLVSGAGKRLVPNPTVLAELKKIGVRDAGDVSTATLGLFPTVDGWEERVLERFDALIAQEEAPE